MGGEKKKTHQLKPSGADWSVETGGRNVEQIVTFIKGFDATRIAQAATAYKDAHKAVGDVRKAIEEQAGQLAKVWEGNASVEAQKALGVLYVTMGELAEKLDKMHTPVDNLANVVRKHQAFIDDTWKGVMPTWANQDLGSWNDSIPDIYSTYSGVYGGDDAKSDFGSQDELAGLHLQTFGNDLQHVHAEIPDSVEKVLRDIDYPVPNQDTPPPVQLPNNNNRPYGNVNASPYDGSGYTGLPAGQYGTDNPGYGTTDPSTGYPTDPNGTYPPGGDGTGDGTGGNGDNGGTGTGTSPTGVNPVGTTGPGGTNPAYNPAVHNPSATGTNPSTSLQDFNPANTAGHNPAGTHPTAGTTGYGSPSTSSYGPGTTGGPGTGTGGGVMGANPAATSIAGRGATTGTGMPFLPMGAGGGAGAQESEKPESTTWLHEDDDVWGSDPGTVVNSRIG
ncbi:WXG100 family type VII secretion target [Actinomadura sp. ATCC 31491]|uniref:WXG100 family type VII secretion target n=1 Tax=Actinomadura luzonensis TaxID=2805427 RepID=A0ABT0G9M1_9ACTN|nr:WXG100 family type VII secretion target [Actinomadura luzonensis]MCK2221286.1 WXG100 family type VII secretion target [Actinomadura luzonensis]